MRSLGHSNLRGSLFNQTWRQKRGGASSVLLLAGLHSEASQKHPPSTAIAIKFVGSYIKALYRNCREPTQKVTLVVEGRESARDLDPA